jgi:pimeloyl-ACP methyl ester carboxylesterase
VLVGHSLAAFNVRMYYAFYPDEVAGIVLIDPTPEDTDTRNPAMPRRRAPNLPRAIPHLLISTLGRLGAFRLTASHPGPPPSGFTAEQWTTLSALLRQFKTVEADFQKGPALPSARQVQTAPGPGNLPLVVLSAGAPRVLPAEAHRINLELHKEIARRSTRGKQITLEQSGHMIPYDAPEAVVEAVREVVSDARQDRAEHQATANAPASH